ncbi:hypothetical protein BX600DRAFT_532765 [Xylariales sp. PMI_506]|nr:hypothetical protein BX600DRAFT_532765 [Xylariales sp. PMI_506]
MRDLAVRLRMNLGAGPPKELESTLCIDPNRLWHEIHHTAQWGAIPGSQGMARLSLSDDDQQVRDYFVNETKRLGCRVTIDEMGNIMAVLPGQNNNIPPIGIGSHLDTQPAGGRFDGILGVLAAVEVLRTIRNSNMTTYAPVAAINWTNEEGARFTPGCSGSAVWAGHTPLTQAHALEETNSSCTMKQELRRINYLGPVAASFEANPLSAHFELHIEQNRRLQDAGKRIGIVTDIQGVRWYSISIHGQRAHAGSTPMPQRADAMVGAARMILFLDMRARKLGAVATAGVVNLDRPSSNTVPGKVTFTVDLRHPIELVLDQFESAIRDYVDELKAANDKFEVEMSRIWHSPAAQMDKVAMSCSRAAAHRVVGCDSTMSLISLAGHDSALAALRVPTSMIFVPSKDGISHAPEEFTAEEECGTGAQVLLESVLAYDDILGMS